MALQNMFLAFSYIEYLCKYNIFGLRARDVIDIRQIDKSTFSICQLNWIEWLGIESK